MKKLLLHSPNPQDGTAFYRAAPWKRLNNVEVVDCPRRLLGWAELYDVDIAFFQRPSSQLEILQITTCKSFGIPVVVDYDDYAFDIDESNPAYDYYKRDVAKAILKEALRLATLVTVSTPALMSALLEQVPEANITVVKNAIDTELFDVSPSTHERTKSIVLRGGGSHAKDWGLYKDQIISVMNDNPDWSIHIMGFHPEWVSQVPNAKFYQFTTIPEYFSCLNELRPAIGIVPLEDTTFNRCKSNIAFMEFALAGAAVFASNLPEFSGAMSMENFTGSIGKASEWVWVCNEQLGKITLLRDENEKRADIVEHLKKEKYKPVLIQRPSATQEQFHEYALAHGHNQEDEAYAKAHNQAAQWLVERTNAKNALELGCGTGGTLIELLKLQVMAYGIDSNELSIQYFRDHHPLYSEQVFLGDLTQEPISQDDTGDLLLSIEVFEHIPKPDEWFIEYLTALSSKFRWFYFSSTPYHTNPSFDQLWGHINVKRTKHWIEIFEKSGWKFVENPRKLTHWDCLFKSEKVS